jgi:hypothetical protein
MRKKKEGSKESKSQNYMENTTGISKKPIGNMQNHQRQKQKAT